MQKLKQCIGEDSWAVKRLHAKIDNQKIKGITDLGRISVTKKMTLEQLKQINKATQDFLKSKTSTIKGIKETIKKTKASFKAKFGDDEELEDEEAETIYNFFADSEFRDIVHMIEPSDAFIAIVQEAREKNSSYDNFGQMISDYIMVGSDTNLKNKLQNIYNKYISR